jgi:hypothetical protein
MYLPSEAKLGGVCLREANRKGVFLFVFLSRRRHRRAVNERTHLRLPARNSLDFRSRRLSFKQTRQT